MTIYLLLMHTKYVCEITGIYENEEIAKAILNNFKENFKEKETIIADSDWHFVTDVGTFMKIEKWEIEKEIR